jgi:hypothetical protein
MEYDNHEWTGAARVERAVRDEMMNMSIVERYHASAHPQMRIDQGKVHVAVCVIYMLFYSRLLSVRED